jgi:uncharacterized membrane protein YobD (UPF0266 family)
VDAGRALPCSCYTSDPGNTFYRIPLKKEDPAVSEIFMQLVSVIIYSLTVSSSKRKGLKL